MDKKIKIIEAIVFSSKNPVQATDISDILKIKKEEVSGYIKIINNDYKNSVIEIFEGKEGFFFKTKNSKENLFFNKSVKQIKLTKAAWEVLSVIILYQPITRSEIENIRDVSLSPGIIDSLLEYGLIKFGKRRETPGRPMTLILAESFFDIFAVKGIEDISIFKNFLKKI